MVVQRETEMTMWGWANPNEKISINANWGASAETVTNSDSTWSVKLKTIDILPTILDAVNMEVPQNLPGLILWDNLKSEK